MTLKIVLVVDDEIDMADTCIRLLERMGCECLQASDSPQAISLINSGIPDLILTDYNLPHGDGFEIANLAHQMSPPRPVIMMTGYHTSEMAQAAKEAGVSAYLRKPFTTAELTKAVLGVLGD
ncbi:MAG: response regulator [Candidatus Binataceae bacterium]